MPEISRFFGIVIRMYYFPKEHPPAHFHAIYGDCEVLIDIETFEVLRGRLPDRALRMVVEWAQIHRQELLENWRRCRGQEPLLPVVPLD